MLTNEDVMAFTDTIRPSLKIMNAVGFADMNITPPDIDFFPDGNQFFDPNLYLIHIGIYGINDMFKPNDTKEYLSALNYVRGHEEQHVRSTASRPYAIAIQKGCEIVLEYIQQEVDGYKRRFKKESDYETYANCELPQKGIYISWNMVHEIVAGIANSLEDGRIERIRAGRFPGYEALRMYHRALFWKNNNEKFEPWEKIQFSDAEKLRIIVNQILSLATCQLYGKGFALAYTGTPLMDEVNSYMPAIARAVMAPRTRGLIDPMREICKGLAPLIYHTCKLSAMDVEVKKALEALLKNIISSMLDNTPSFDLSEGNEDTEGEDECNISSAFGMSDLVITLDDETYDKMKEKAKKSGKKDSGIMIRREHPLEEEEEEKKEKGSSSSSKSDDPDKVNGGGEGEGEMSDSENSENGGGSGGSSKFGKDGDEDSAGEGSSSGKSKNGSDGDETSSGSGSSGDEEGKDGKKSKTGKSGKKGGADEIGDTDETSGYDEHGTSVGRESVKNSGSQSDEDDDDDFEYEPGAGGNGSGKSGKSKKKDRSSSNKSSVRQSGNADGKDPGDEAGKSSGNTGKSDENSAGEKNEKNNQNGKSTDGSSDDKKSSGADSKDDQPEQPGAKGQKNSNNNSGEGSNNQSKPSGVGRKNGAESGGQFEEAQVEAAMKAAAETCREESAAAITMVNTSASRAKSTRVKEVADKHAALNGGFTKGICDNFRELKRAYKLTDQLPPVLAARGKTLHRKNEQYFKSLSTPNRTFLDSGSVDPSRIYGLSFGDTDIFRKQGIDKKFDGCAYILIDNSGSMRGDKRQEACKAAAVIEEGFKGLIPFKIVAFDYGGCPIHEVVKGWEETYRLNCCWNFFKYGRYGGGNEDGLDIQIATKELLLRPEKKKMLIVLSDGTPGDEKLCQKAINDARKAGISVHGIYFEEGDYANNPAFAEMYQRDYICCGLDEIDTNLYNIMHRFSRS